MGPGHGLSVDFCIVSHLAPPPCLLGVCTYMGILCNSFDKGWHSGLYSSCTLLSCLRQVSCAPDYTQFSTEKLVTIAKSPGNWHTFIVLIQNHYCNKEEVIHCSSICGIHAWIPHMELQCMQSFHQISLQDPSEILFEYKVSACSVPWVLYNSTGLTTNVLNVLNSDQMFPPNTIMNIVLNFVKDFFLLHLHVA